ncbi:MAG: dynamin family protein, partial [Candidatus Acidiferrum sp.]
MRTFSEQSAVGPNSAESVATRASVACDVDAVGKLERLAEIGRELGVANVSEEASGLAARLVEGRFHVACIGQFKRGKSTLLNALVDDRALPTGVTPVTTVATVLRYGETRRTRIRFHGGTWKDIDKEDLLQYVSEEHNPENVKRVAGAEVFIPNQMLADGLCLVDTPGLGSVFAANTTSTEQFVPHIDAAILVVGADPPIGGEELKLVEQVGKQVEHVIVVLNKADRTSGAERRIAGKFTRKVIEKRLGREVGPIYEISAYERLQKGKAGWDWNAFVIELKKLVDGADQGLVRLAGERGFRRFSEQILASTLEEREALTRPIEESERRIARLQGTITEAELSLREMGYLFLAEEHRLSNSFLERRRSFLETTLPKATTEYRAALSELSRGFGPSYRRAAMCAAQVRAERYVGPWLKAEQERADEEYRNAAERFVSLGNDFVRRLSESGMSGLARLPSALNSEKGFRAASRFRFEGLIHVAQPSSPLRYVADAVLGLVHGFFVLEKEAERFFNYLMEMNSGRVQADVVDRVYESKVRLEAEIRKLLREVSHVAERALDSARDTQGRSAAAVKERLTRLDAAEEEI